MQGRSRLSTATMVMRLQEAVADVEQLKADLLNSEDPARQPAQPTTVPKKKRKAASMIQHPALRHSQGRSSKLKANGALARGHGDSSGELHSCAFTPAGVGFASCKTQSMLPASLRVKEGQTGQDAAASLLELCLPQDVCRACISYT